MKKIILGLMLVASLATAKIDVIESITTNVYAMNIRDKVSIQKVCIDSMTFVLVVSSSGVAITPVTNNELPIKCVNGK